MRCGVFYNTIHVRKRTNIWKPSARGGNILYLIFCSSANVVGVLGDDAYISIFSLRRWNFENMVVSYFKTIFATTHDFHTLNPSFTCANALTPQATSLSLPPSSAEVQGCIAQMSPTNCPGLDGIQPFFYKHLWTELGHHISSFVSNCF